MLWSYATLLDVDDSVAPVLRYTHAIHTINSCHPSPSPPLPKPSRCFPSHPPLPCCLQLPGGPCVGDPGAGDGAAGAGLPHAGTLGPRHARPALTGARTPRRHGKSPSQQTSACIIATLYKVANQSPASLSESQVLEKRVSELSTGEVANLAWALAKVPPHSSTTHLSMPISHASPRPLGL